MPEQPLKILLVEDDAADALLFRTALRRSRLSCELTECSRAEEALELLSSGAGRWDLLVVDHGLPGMSGLDLCLRLLAEEPPSPEGGETTPSPEGGEMTPSPEGGEMTPSPEGGEMTPCALVILTGASSVEVAIRALKAGVHDYIVKDPQQGYLEMLPVVLPQVVTHFREHLARRQAEEALRASEERLRHADRRKSELIAALEAKNVELERFTYSVSHDLKSPLVTIKGFLGLVRKDAAAGDEKRLEHDLQRIEAAADRMSVLLDDLLRLSRIGRHLNTVDTVPMQALASEAVSLLAAEIAERRVDVEIMPRMPPVIGDRTRLVQVLQNLIHNAIKYMGTQPAPRVSVGVRPDADDRDASSGEAQRVFFVRDNGAGIEPADRERIFGLFERLDTAGEGTGVGLALVKRIVEVHGGRIWVESEGQMQGSTFCFTLPGPLKP